MSEQMDAPSHLTPRARDIYYRKMTELIEAKILKSTDMDALAMYASAMDDYILYSGIVRAEGPTFVTRDRNGDEIHKPRPEVSMAGSAWNRAAIMMRQLAMTPQGKKASGKTQKNKEPDGMEGLLDD